MDRTWQPSFWPASASAPSRLERLLVWLALKINPSYVNGWLHLAEACKQDSDPAGARDAVNQALRCDPSNAAAQRLQSQLKQ